MKLFIATIVLGLLIFSSMSFAETPVDKGNWIVGSDFGLTSSSGDINDGGTRIYFAPRFQLFVSNHTAIGVSSTIQIHQSENINIFSIGPHVTFALNSKAERTAPFFDIIIHYQRFKEATYQFWNYDNTTIDNGINLGAAFGFLCLVGKDAALSPAINIEYSQFSIGGKQRRNTLFGFKIGLLTIL
jgi:hypothetical protein